MSLYGALFSGVSGLAAQSSAMGAIADNVTNINTIGYKGTSSSFQTLVTKQVSLTKYSPGGVQSKPVAGIDVQGLLTSTNVATDLAVSGSGFFAVNEAATPGAGDLWAFTRAGAFSMDESGYLRNTSGYYLQGWSLLPFDQEPTAAVVKVGDINYMKAYKDSHGNTTYINDNIIDNDNLKPLNLNSVGGNATPTKQIRFGANLPASDPVYDASKSEEGGLRSLASLIYDSLGNSHNINFQYTKETSNSWELDAQIPAGAASLVVYSERETQQTEGSDVYSARGQLEFTDIPRNQSEIIITTPLTLGGPPVAHTFVFRDDGVNVDDAATNTYTVDIQNNVVDPNDAVGKLIAEITAHMPGGGRFVEDGDRIAIEQSISGYGLDIDASGCLGCRQTAANPALNTGIPTGQFTIPEIGWPLKNTAAINFQEQSIPYNPADFNNEVLSIGGTTFHLHNGGPAPALPTVGVDISSATSIEAMVALLSSSINTNVSESSRWRQMGNTLEFRQSETGGVMDIDLSGTSVAVTGVCKNNASAVPTNISSGAGSVGDRFAFNNDPSAESGSKMPAVRFNADGTPMYIGADYINIEWANGAQDMTGVANEGSSINLFTGNSNTGDGLTHLSGEFTPNYINQDGAKFGNFAGVTIGANGIVTALFDNGDTRPIAMVPLATFVNANGMEAMQGNAWVATDYSGQPTLREAGSGGAGSVSSASLEASTVDLGEEFTSMITTQRAYSASAKIITTSDEMLEELMGIKR
ncbi:MAG: flagellar hook-basal body complex protein [Alphaproteobacteria bacterium]|nr:flagellar hook-basal body complex protein [Alphaproteobacteria bacterium]